MTTLDPRDPGQHDSFDTFEERRGYSEEFIARVWAKRREQKRQEALRNEIEANKMPAAILAGTSRTSKLRGNAMRAALARAPRAPGGSVEAIIAWVERYWQCEAGTAAGSARTVQAMTCRFHAMRDVSHHWPELSLSSIGYLFGGRDHTCVINALAQCGLRKGGKHVPKRYSDAVAGLVQAGERHHRSQAT